VNNFYERKTLFVYVYEHSHRFLLIATQSKFILQCLLLFTYTHTHGCEKNDLAIIWQKVFHATSSCIHSITVI
jgi:hypothetical protein